MASPSSPRVLDGLTALVTGAGTGLGRGIAFGLAAAGAKVHLVGRRTEPLDLVAEALAAEGLSARPHPADVTSEADIQRLGDAVGRIDILVNNAGTSDRQPWENVTETDWDRILDLNLRAAFRLSQIFAPGMVDAGGGRIINIASVYGMIAPDRSLYPDAASFDLPSYGASKAGLIGLTRHLAAILGPSQVTVNAITPGMMETERTAGLLAADTRAALIGRTPLRRLGQPADMQAAVVFLASPGASFITGHNLVVDGGFSLH